MKWKVTALMSGFDIDEDNMELVIKNRFGRVCYSYNAEDFFSDGQGGWYFVMPNAKNGTYTAYLTCYRGDEDFPMGAQRVTDVQTLVTVGDCSCDCCSMSCPCGCEDCGTEGLEVRYERVWTVNFIDGCYLADKDGNPILDSNGNFIRFINSKEQEEGDVRINMTSQEFKHWMDDKDENGTIDTRREIEDALGGIDDDTELATMTAEDAHNMVNEIFNNN